MEKRSIRIGDHRGKPRIWIQGKRLEAAGWPRDRRFTLVIKSTSIELIPDEDGERKVSASTKAAIIDINTPAIAEALPAGSQAIAIITADKIVIKRDN